MIILGSTIGAIEGDTSSLDSGSYIATNPEATNKENC